MRAPLAFLALIVAVCVFGATSAYAGGVNDDNVVIAHAVCMATSPNPPEFSCQDGSIRGIIDSEPDTPTRLAIAEMGVNLSYEELSSLLAKQEGLTASQQKTSKSALLRRTIMRHSADRIQSQLKAEERIVSSIFITKGLDSVGWNIAEIESSDMFHDRDQLFAAGYIEGYATAPDMLLHYNSLYEMFFGPNSTFPAAAYDAAALFIKKQDGWFRQQMIERKDKEARYMALFLLDHQVRGVKQGYHDRAPTSMLRQDPVDYARPSAWDPTFWQYRGELMDILHSLYPNVTKSCWEQNVTNALNYERETTHCSALGRMITRNFTDGTQTDDFAVAHATWNDYRTMFRYYKTYTLPLDFLGSKHTDLYEPYVLMQSSYPGLVHSFDDYYMLGRTAQRLVVMETTNSICDKSLFTKITPASLMSWQRALMANLIARDGDEWTSIFSQDNSGTYNNQFMVYDMKKFVPNDDPEAVSPEQRDESQFEVVIPQSIKYLPTSQLPSETVRDEVHSARLASRLNPGFLWIIEQMPGDFERADVTEILVNKTYWPSYNRPYFPRIHEAMGFTEAAKRSSLGDYYSYDKTARALIFGELVPGVSNLDNMMHLMRYNNYENDPASQGNPAYTIAARYDLTPTFKLRKPDGATDCKITTALAMNGESLEPPQSMDGEVKSTKAASLSPFKPTFFRRLASRIQRRFSRQRMVLNRSHTKPEIRRAQRIHTIRALDKDSNRLSTTVAIASLAIAGPTDETEPTFVWSEYETKNHVRFVRQGLPDRYQFEWISLESSH